MADTVILDADSDSESTSSSVVLSNNSSTTTSRPSPLWVRETLILIAKELGERTEENKRYRNKKSLANLVATCKFIAGTLQTFLYVQDLQDGEMKGLRYAIINGDDDIAIGILNKYPERHLKRCVNIRFSSQVGKNVTFTMLHMAATNKMYDTIEKLHQLGAKWLYAENFDLIQSDDFRDTLSSFPALQRTLRNINWAPNFVGLIAKEKHTCYLLAKYWPESYPFVARFTYPPALLPGRPRDREYCMTLVHLMVLLCPDRNNLNRVKAALKQYPDLKRLPGTERECSIISIAVEAQNEAVLDHFLYDMNGREPYFVDNRGYSLLHFAVEQVLLGDNGLGPRGQSGSSRCMGVIMQKRINVMVTQTMAPYKTPLLMLASHILVDWSEQNRVIKRWIDEFAKEEKRYANAWGFGPVVYTMNRPDSNGNTVLGYIAKAIVNYHKEQGSKPLEDLFSKMITKYNADINLDVNTFPSPTTRAYVHSIKWMADKASGRARFKKLVDGFGGRLHHAEALNIEAPTPASADFPPDQPHAVCLPANHPYALAQPFQQAFIEWSPSQLSQRQADLPRQWSFYVQMLMDSFGKSRPEAEEQATRLTRPLGYNGP
ncbi:hypothetical protein FLONG3_10672 [Fusarium longipes]|uniref:Ankyrin repeat n=1 Tax=Fusarium longipes TaxID=694270 RepID=A0A395RLP0_9HYPO|nr:hypothetical protein FLONG3_10672 [Fusarium longipes]